MNDTERITAFEDTMLKWIPVLKTLEDLQAFSTDLEPIRQARGIVFTPSEAILESRVMSLRYGVKLELWANGGIQANNRFDIYDVETALEHALYTEDQRMHLREQEDLFFEYFEHTRYEEIEAALDLRFRK